MNSNLIAVQRPDKNGHVVTRWVRPDSATGTSRNIPAVKSATTPTAFDTVKELCLTALREGEYEDTTISSEDELLQHLEVLRGKTLDNYLAAIEEEPDSFHEHHLLSVLHNKDSKVTANNVLRVIRMDRDIDPAWSFSGKGGTYAYGSAKEVIAGLGMYRWSGFVPPEDLTDDSDPTVKKALALANVAMQLWDSGQIEEPYENTICIQDGNLVSLILERPDDADEIAETASVIESVDGNRIREAMNAASGLRSGVL